MKQCIPLEGPNVTERTEWGKQRSCPRQMWGGTVHRSMFQDCKEITVAGGESIRSEDRGRGNRMDGSGWVLRELSRYVEPGVFNG